MDIQPYLGDGENAEPIHARSLVVRVDPKDRERVLALVRRTGMVREVNDEASFAVARQLAGELKALANEIQDSKRAAKRPFEAVLAAIEELAKDVWAHGKSEQERLLARLNGYVAQLEAARKAEEQKRIASLRAQKEEAERKIREAQTEQDLAKAAQAKVERELAEELALTFASQPAKSLVPEGRVDHKYSFKLANLPELIAAGGLKLLRWEIDHLACMDAVRAQLERDPDKMPVLPGIQITREISVSVKARARTQ
jgi:hypothetical protein